jgi:L-asparagine transporter-like permease
MRVVMTLAYILCYLLVLILLMMAVGEVSLDAANTHSLPGVSRDFVPPKS